MSDESKLTVSCAICSNPVAIGSQSCKANEAGKAVHEACYTELVTKRKPSSNQLQSRFDSFA
jgi:hypothetical protein